MPIKPANIMIGNLNAEPPQVKLLDFGIAKLGGEQNSPSLTATGQLLGTPLYMSPEQCSGDELDARSDLYSTGCVMYETITGRRPFDGENAFVCMLKHLNEEAAQLAGDGISSEYSDLIDRAMAKQPAQRFSSALELKTAVENLPNIYRRIAPPRNTTKFLVLVVLLTGLCGLLGLALLNHDVPPAKTAVVERSALEQSQIVQPKSVPPTLSPPKAYDHVASDEVKIDDPYNERKTTGKDEFEQRARDIQYGIDWLNSHQRQAEAQTFPKQLDSFKAAAAAGSYAPPAASAAELHAVGVQWGRQPNQFNHHGVADIKVTYNARPIVLAINNYNMYKLTCNLNLAPGAKILKVIVSGNSPEKVEIKGLPTGIPVETLTAFPAYGKEEFGYADFLSKIETLTSLKLTTLAPDRADGKYEIGSGDRDWCFQHLAYRMTALWQNATTAEREATEQRLSKARFYSGFPETGSSPSVNAGQISRAVSLFQFDLHGPLKSTEQKINFPFADIELDPKSGACFWTDGELYQRSSSGNRERMELPEGLSEYIADLCLAPAGNTLYVNGIGKVDKYDLSGKQWSHLCSFPSSTRGFAFCASQKCFYTLNQTSTSPGHSYLLYKVDMKGKVLAEKKLDKPIWVVASNNAANFKLVWRDNLLIAVANVDGMPAEQTSPFAMLHVIEPSTGRVLLSNRIEPH